MKKKTFTKPFLVRFTSEGFRKAEADAWLRHKSLAEHLRDLAQKWKMKRR
jgi:hypothetical protein